MKSIAESTSGNASLLFKNWPMFSIFVDFFKRIFFPFLLSFFLSFSSIVNSLHNFGEFLQFRFHCRIKVRIQNKFLYTIFLFFLSQLDITSIKDDPLYISSSVIT